MIHQYLEELEARIDPEIEEQLLSQWSSFAEGKLDTGFFSPNRQNKSVPRLDWPAISVNQALDDLEVMALRQLSGCSGALEHGTGAIMNVRADYGTGILSSVFGAEIFRMDDTMNTLPTTRSLAGGTDAVRRIVEGGIPDLNAGYGGRCLEMGKLYVDLFASYPKVSTHVLIYHPDLQGPMDICELLWGSGIFVDLIEEPDLVHSLLELVTETYIRFMHEWERIVPPRNGNATHWGMLHKGHIMIRDDSAMNLSPEMFDEFIKPYDQRLLSEFGGGAIHFCGRGDHYIGRLAQMNNLHAVNMSQPECNDMERILSNTVDKGIALIGMPRNEAEALSGRGRELHGRVHCW